MSANAARRLDAAAHPAPRPFLKWAGGKRQLLSELLARMPRRFGTYHEPFLGGGALFLEVLPERAVLSDANERLVRTWRAVRDDVDAVVELLSSYPHDKEFFLELRASEIDARSDVEVAAWFIYLNRTGFNGLYRVNGSNRFNVPWGKYRNPTICDEGRLRAVSHALRNTEIHCEDFGKVLERAEQGDFVYFDPPYVPLSATSSFTAYQKGGFGLEQHARLRDTARELKRRGVRVLLSNSSADEVYGLYGRGFQSTEVLASRAINSVASRRGKVPELLIW